MQTYIGKRSTGNDTTDIMKDVHHLIFGVILFAGCHEQPPQDPDQVNSGTAISTDLQSDLWHAHRHIHDGVQVHDHEHESGFTGGHEHQHGHAHRHSETPLDGTIVSLRRLATPGQSPGSGTLIPPGLHLEVLPGLPKELNLCLLSEAEESGWDYWGEPIDKITIELSIGGKEPTKINCLKKPTPRQEGPDFPFFCFSQQVPTEIRQQISENTSRLHISVFALTIETSRFIPREELYLKNGELSVSLQ